MKNSILEWGLRLGLGGIFIFASWHKITAPDQFAKILYGYAVFPHQTINILAIVMPFVELICGLSLVTGVFKRSALLLIEAMLICFIVLITFNLIRGHEFDCGCFSLGQTHGTWTSVWLLIRDFFMLAASFFLFRLFNLKLRRRTSIASGQS